jgi:hypothetical protein
LYFMEFWLHYQKFFLNVFFILHASKFHR